MIPLAPWHQYAHDAVSAGRAEAVVQEKLRPIVLRIKNLKKETDADHTAQIAALERKADAMRAELRQLPVRVSRYVWLACERHLRDLEHGHERGLRFDEKAADVRVKFFSLLTHNKGKWAGQPLTLEPWQQFYIASLFGWKRADGTRRFRESYLEVARKNGKSTVGSGVCLLLLVLDGEAGAEIYTAATKKDQAKIVFEDAQNMARKSVSLKKRVTVQQRAIFVKATSSSMKAMSSDSKTEDGLNPHGIYIDEYHAHPNSGLYSVLKSATGARAQPLLSIITTAGYLRNGPCAQLRRSNIELLEQKYHDDAYFCIIYALDEGDDWQDEATWQKANPNLGVSVSLDYLREQFLTAQRLPSEEVPFKTKHLNLWTDSSTVWLPHQLWMQGAHGTPVDELRGRKAWGGLDLASVSDITALVLIFPTDGGAFDVRCWFWVPEEKVDERTRKDSVPYRQWVNEGWLLTTPGNVTDYNFIKKQVHELCAQYLVQIIEYDRYNASQMVVDLTQEGVPMQPFGQGFVSMNAPTKELERLVLDGRVHHYGNPVLAWMMGNIELERDAADNIKISKGSSKEKVDGAVALVEAIGGYMTAPAPQVSVYETRGLRDL